MPWKEATIMTQKEEFVKKALAEGVCFSDLCKEYKITRKTGYRLLNQYKNLGLKGLQAASRTPHNSPTKTSHEIEEKIITVRIQHPAWGARKIRAYLLRKGILQLPAPSTITEILRRNGHLSVEESLKRQAFIRFERENANDLWQMDFKGYFQLANKELCYPLTVIDDHSRFSLCLKACKNEQYLPVKKQLSEVFRNYGLPKQINVDNGNPWGNSKLLSYTQLTVWLMQLGVNVTHSRPRHPQTNGKNERFHRTLKKELLSNKVLNNFSHAQKLFDTWRHMYNYERPHQAISMLVPAQRYQPSPRCMPEQLPAIEYSDDAILRKARGNGYISYCNNEYLVGEAFVGQHIEVRPHELGGLIELYFGKHKIYSYEITTG